MKNRTFDLGCLAHTQNTEMITTAERKEILLSNALPFFFHYGKPYKPEFKNMGGGIWEMKVVPYVITP